MHQGTMNHGERFIEYALGINAIELVPEGRKLKSGRISPYFFNSGKFDSGATATVLASLYADVIGQNFREDCDIAADVLYGPPYKGAILAPIVAMKVSRLGCGDIHYCTSRKEPKNHGEGGVFVGAAITPGSRVIIIDDVITDGGTKREAVNLIRQHGGIPISLILAFDRQECGAGSLSARQEFERECRIPVHAIATCSDLIRSLEKKSVKADEEKVKDILFKIQQYQHEYGC